MNGYKWIHPKTKKMYARVQIRQKDGRYKTYLRRAQTEREAARLAREMMLEIIFTEVREMSFDEFKEKIFRIYEH